MGVIYLGLGSNLGDRELYLACARLLITEWVGQLKQQSSLHYSEPWGFMEQPTFVNQVVVMETKLKPELLLEKIKFIEYVLGRTKRAQWHEREIDIDILFYDDRHIDTDDLKIPHPYISSRLFVLDPLLEICPNFEHPILNMSIRDLRQEYLKHRSNDSHPEE